MQLSNAKIQNTIKILEASEIDETNQNSRISSNLELLQEELKKREKDKKDEKKDLQEHISKLREKLKERPKKFVLEEVHARYPVLREEFLRRGWVEVTQKSILWDFKWTWNADRCNISKTSKKLINHFYNFSEIGTKRGLLLNLKKLQTSNNSENIYSFFPRAYLLERGINSSEEYQLFIQDFHRTQEFIRHSKESLGIFSNDEVNFVFSQGNKSINLPPIQFEDDENNIWIAKPSEQARGVGIQLFKDLNQLLDFVNNDTQYPSFVVQKYIEKPLLVKGKKFDIRQFVLVTSLDPLIVWIFDDNYLRFCTQDYKIDDLTNVYLHLTNHQVQKNSDNFYETEIHESQWSFSMFQDYLINDLGKQKTFWEEQILPKIEKLIISSLKSWPKEAHRKYSFELLGFDILIKDNFAPYLIEINTNPGLHLLTEIVKIHHTNAQLDLLKVVMDERNKWESEDNNVEELKIGSWRLIYKEKKKIK